MLKTLIDISTVAAILAGISLPVIAQENLTYQVPHENIRELVEAPTTPSVMFTRSGDKALLLERPGFPSIGDVSQPVIGLAGLRLNPANTSSAVGSSSTNILVRDVKSGAENQIAGLPTSARISNLSFSPDEQHIAFTHSTDKGVELWMADLRTFEARRLITDFVNDTYGSTLSWAPDGSWLLAKLVPSGRSLVPVADPVPTGPIVQENLGRTSPSRTYQNLLQNAHDEALFDYFVTSQLAAITLDGQIKPLGKPGIFRSVSHAPGGEYLLVNRIERPYSYLVPVNSFPYHVLVWDTDGNEVKNLYESPLSESVPIGFDNTVAGPRSYAWRPDKPATLYYVNALDGGDSRKRIAYRDEILQLEAPFDGQPEQLIMTNFRFSGINWIDGQYAVLNESWRQTRTMKAVLFNPETGDTVRTIRVRSTEDAYSDPGRFVMTTNDYNRSVVLRDKGKNPVVFTFGSGASPEGDRPFLMRWDLITDKTDTLFKSVAPYYEQPVFFDNTGHLIISRESVEEAPNYFSVNLRNRRATQITAFPDPYPSLQGIEKRQVQYSRADGLSLSATLYLPKGYTIADGPLPMLLWAYPREYKSADAASQVRGTPYQFTRISWGSPIYWVTRGYAVLDNADMPIVGEGDQQPNDTFVEQLEANAKAAIDYMASSGIADPKRVGVGGHSYGAFMTANLLAHTDLFAAGLARSGAYNRTFTPFGFQAEERTYWQAPEVYYQMSPFSFADRIKTPILLIHGVDDENSGTFPIQSERLYNAIKGHGGTTRLVFLPKEFHGYRAKESILHTLWEMDQWLETYVKNRTDNP